MLFKTFVEIYAQYVKYVEIYGHNAIMADSKYVNILIATIYIITKVCQQTRTRSN